MPAEVVGTAFVRIRAITTGLAKDIEDGVKKGGAGDAGGKVGDDFAKGFDEKLKKGVDKSTKDIDKSVSPDGGKKGGSKLGDSFLASFKESLGKGDFSKANEKLTKALATDFKKGFSSELQKAMDDEDFVKVGNLLKKRAKIDEEGGEGTASKFLAGFKKIFTKDGDKAGSEAGGGFGGGFAKGAALKAAAIFSPALTGAISGALQYVVSLVGQVGFLYEGLIGIGGAGVGAFAAVGFAALPIFLAFKASTPALEKFQKNLEGVTKQWTEVGAATQQTLLGPLTQALNTTTKLIPMFRGFGRAVGEVVGEFALWQAEWLTNERNAGMLRGTLQGFVPILRSLLTAVGNVIDTFIPFLFAASPAAQLLADDLAKITGRLQETIDTAAGNGSLSGFFIDAYEKGKLILGALADILIGLHNILLIGSENSTSFFTTFDNWAARFRSFTESEEGKNKLGKIFEQANAIAHEFNGLIGDIFKALSGGVFDVGGAEGIVGFIQLLRTDVVPFLTDFLSQVSSSYGPALLALSDSFAKLITTASEGGLLGSFLSTLNVSLQILNGVLIVLLGIPGFDKFLGFLLSFSSVLGALALILPGVKFADLVGGLTKLAGLVLAPVIPFFASLLGLAEGSGAIAVLTGAISALATALGVSFGAAIGIALVAIVALAAAAYLVVRNWDTLKRWFFDFFDFVKRNFQTIIGFIFPIIGIPLLILHNWDKIAGFFSKLPGIIGRAFSTAGGAAVDFGAKVLNGILDVVKKIPGLLLTVLEAIPKIFGWLAIKSIQLFILSIIALPQLVVYAITTFGPKLIAFFTAAWATVLAWLATALTALVQFFINLPGQVVAAVGDIFAFLRNAATAVKDWIAQKIAEIVTFFVALPGQLLAAGLLAFQWLVDKATELRDWIWQKVTEIIQFFIDLPGNLVAAGASAFDWLKEKATEVKTWIGDRISDIVTFVTDLPGKITTAASGMWDGIKDAFKSAVNAIIKGWNGIEFKIPGFKVGPVGYDGFTLGLPDIPELAKGGIFSRPTLATIGEAGREAVLPLTRPDVLRALLAKNPSVAAILQQAMPWFNSLADRVRTAGGGVSINNTGGVSSIGGINTPNATAINLAQGAIIVQLSSGSPEEAFQAGQQVWAGLQAAMAERSSKIQQRSI